MCGCLRGAVWGGSRYESHGGVLCVLRYINDINT